MPGKALREIYEVLNCKKAFEHIEKCIDNKIPLSEEVIKDIHELLVDNIFSGGIYRTSTVYISGASFVPPDWTKLREEMHHLVTDYEDKKKDTDPIWLGVFDTAFHQTMPQHAFMYGVPYGYYEKYKVRRYGFHGTSHYFVSRRAAEMLGQPIEKLKIITCHLQRDRKSVV